MSIRNGTQTFARNFGIKKKMLITFVRFNYSEDLAELFFLIGLEFLFCIN